VGVFFNKDIYCEMKELIRHILREVKQKWTDDSLEQEAKKYESRGDFQKNSNSAYIVARNRGKEFFDKITQHMTNKLEYWSEDDLRDIALKYNTKKEFREKNPKASGAARRKGKDFYDTITSHMDNLQRKPWSDDDLRKEASKYSNLTDFTKLSPSAYVISRRKGDEFFNSITSHMSRQTQWTDEMLKNEALKYKTRGEFQKNSNAAYLSAKNRGILDDICTHMERAGSKYLRYIYVYEFPDKSVYVGLTYNLNERNQSHTTQPTSSVYQHAKLIGFNPKMKSISELLDKDEAAEVENKMIEKYKSEGWTILNKAKAGALGGSTLKWTDDAIKNEISKYETLNDFIVKSPSAFNAAKKRGKDFLTDVTKNLIKVQIKLTDEELQDIASKYINKMDFIKNEPRAYSQAKRRGDDIFNKITNHMIIQKIKWPDDMLEKESKKYKSRSEFSKGNPSAYVTSKNRKLLDKFFPKR
jgi:predicted GIY-YIG superfamily endonuclease/cytochrome c553